MEKHHPKVSILMPSLNTAPFIRQCMDSVITQTLKDIEIFCIDAGSTDGTLEILREYEKQDSRIHVIQSDKKSMGYQYNLGIDAASGEYIGMVETDDWIEPETFECLYEAAHRTNTDIVGANQLFYYTKPSTINKPFENLRNCTYNHIISSQTDFSPFPVKPLIWSAIYRRTMITGNNIRFNETPGASFQDESFHFMVLTVAQSLYFLNRYFYHYRQDNESQSINSGEKVYCVCDEAQYYENFLEKLPAKKKQLLKPYMAWKFNHYYWNYNRIASRFQWGFLMRFREEFLSHRADGLLEESSFESKKWKNLNEIINHPVRYFKSTCKNRESWFRDNYQMMLADLPAEALNDFQLMFKEFDERELLNIRYDKYETARIDIKNFGTVNNNVTIKRCSDEAAQVNSPDWFKNTQGSGVVVHSKQGYIDLEMKCVGDGNMRIQLRGKDCRDDYGKRYPVWIYITCFRVDGKELFNGPQLVCHDRPFIHNLKVTDGQIVKIYLEWQSAVDILAKEREVNLKHVDEMQQKIIRLDKAEEEATKALQKKQQKITQLEQEKAKTENQLRNIKNGWSFKIGRIITTIPRAIKDSLGLRRNI